MKALKQTVRTISLDQIEDILKNMQISHIIDTIQEGFVAYSSGSVVVPPVGEMLFENPPGEAHIKYGYIVGDDAYVIKIASGFYENRNLGISPNAGLMLMFSQKTGRLETILLDEGCLTNVRTAAAGAVAARHLAPKAVHRIGILGAGYQGRMQLEYLKPVVPCTDVMVWGLNQEELDAYTKEMTPKGYNIQTTFRAADVANACNLIVTATPSKKALLTAEQIKPGTHITAMGSDTSDKIELDPAILLKTDIIVADSIEQSLSRGEIFQARQAGTLAENRVVELGHVITGKSSARTSDNQISVVDLTGVAIQDIQICKLISNHRL
ncbi:MAG: ornithine cyclodeaminase family protein [Deltaproteobacteria bacterium]|nr:MAG: ornithine cyclodeaminase family protein [Deltaproteobacteria bacterium]RLC17959.1 MAG: ornithine cyclodeaminase family protein [Deltaproteobacteria bacterium]